MSESKVLLVQDYGGEYIYEIDNIYEHLRQELATLPEDSYGYAGVFKVTVEFIPYEQP
jgi:hypothetical protein